MRLTLRLIITVTLVLGACSDPPAKAPALDVAQDLAGGSGDGLDVGSDDALPASDGTAATDGDVADGQVLISGLCALGAPVSGAGVEILAYEGLNRGDVLGTGTTTENGGFEVGVSAGYTGLVLIRVAGAGAWIELGGDQAGFDPDDELLAAVTIDGGGAAGVNVHGLTTLAVELADAYSVGGLAPDKALNEASSRLAEHLLRTGFDPAATPAADLTIGAAPWPSPSTAVGLLHAGLAAMAAALSDAGGAPVTSLDILAALRRDLTDGLFDGLDGQDVPVSVLGQHALDVDTTRWTLAFHTDAFVDSAANASGLGYDVLAAADGFYTAVSTDDGPLYPPEGTVPKRGLPGDLGSCGTTAAKVLQFCALRTGGGRCGAGRQ